MKRLYSVSIAFGVTFSVFAQKTSFDTNTFKGKKLVIDTSVYGTFPRVVGAFLSNNGNYLYYLTHSNECFQISIKGTHNFWEKEINDAQIPVFFVNEDHLLITKLGQDILCLQALGSDQQELIEHVGSFSVSQEGTAEWLLYQLNSPGNELVLRNLATGKQQSFSNITGYQFVDGEQAIILQQQVGDSSSSLSWLDLAKDTVIPVWQGKTHGRLKFSSDGKAVAFEGSSHIPGKAALWYYKTGDENASILITEDNPSSLTRSMTLGYLTGFNEKGDKLFFKLQSISDKPDKSPNSSLASVDVYSYKDLKLQSQQLKEINDGPAEYAYVFDLAGRKLVQLTQQNEYLIRSIQDHYKQDFVLIRKDNGGCSYEWNWNPAALSSIYLVSLVDGSKTCLYKDLPTTAVWSFQLSPDNKYVVYYDAKLRDYFSYTIATGITRNITKGDPDDWLDKYEEDMPDSAYCVNPDYRWAINDQAVFIQSKNGICEADPSGKLCALRLTGNYGYTRHLRFRFLDPYGDAGIEIDPGQPMLLTVLDEQTRDEGYCKVMPGRENKPTLLKMMPCHFESLQKARDTAVYTVRIESAEKFPNQFLTTDFKTYTPITNNHPQKAYNWPISQLVSFETLNGKTTQGILFKPENFDPQKKYPVIIEYYERRIVNLHKFPYPDYSDGARIDIPTYVSSGYLVLTPDIDYEVGHPGKSAYNAIVAAAHYLAQLPWVDKHHMALMGHSFGGFETNYVITHSHIFAAAVSMSGMTNFVSAYGSIIGDGTSRQRQYELNRDRIGVTLWQRPDLYLENSPVFRANQITTPVLMMANKKDADVPYQQGIEFFTALRRLGKKAWMLQYDNGGHQVFDPTDERDLTIRMAQFFSYYLKGEPPPKWMVEGIPATKKGVDGGYELLPGRTP